MNVPGRARRASLELRFALDAFGGDYRTAGIGPSPNMPGSTTPTPQETRRAMGKCLRSVCNDPSILRLQFALPADAVGAFWKPDGIMLVVVEPRARLIDPDVAHVEAIGDVVRAAIVAEHRDPVIDRMPVPGHLALRQNGSTVRPRINRCAGHRHVGNALDQQIALRIE